MLGEVTGESFVDCFTLGMGVGAAARQHYGKGGDGPDPHSNKNEDGSGSHGNGTCAANSMPAEEPVLLADGSTQPIGTIEKGDVVWALDPETGEVGPRAVTETFVHTDPVALVALDLEHADGTSAGRIVVTGNHPVWQAVEGRWLDAERLLVGDWVHDADGEYLRVASIAVVERLETVHNLEVEGLHTFFVATEADGDDAAQSS